MPLSTLMTIVLQVLTLCYFFSSYYSSQGIAVIVIIITSSDLMHYSLLMVEQLSLWSSLIIS